MRRALRVGGRMPAAAVVGDEATVAAGGGEELKRSLRCWMRKIGVAITGPSWKPRCRTCVVRIVREKGWSSA